MAPCACKGSTNTAYKITYKDGRTEVVTRAQGGLSAVRVKLAKSPAGGTYKAIQPPPGS